jgi:hypothetical protein
VPLYTMTVYPAPAALTAAWMLEYCMPAPTVIVFARVDVWALTRFTVTKPVQIKPITATVNKLPLIKSPPVFVFVIFL